MWFKCIVAIHLICLLIVIYMIIKAPEMEDEI